MPTETILREAVEREDFEAIAEILPRFRKELDESLSVLPASARAVRLLQAQAHIEELVKRTRIARARIAHEIQQLPNPSPYAAANGDQTTFQLRY